MAIFTRSTIKTWFETGDFPTEQQFSDFIDSIWHRNDGGVITFWDPLATDPVTLILKKPTDGETIVINMPGIIPEGKFALHKKTGNSEGTVELNDVIIGIWEGQSTFGAWSYKNHLADDDTTNIANYDSVGIGGLSTILEKNIELGSIGVNDIEDYINANDSVNWNLVDNASYFFRAIKNGMLHVYLYVGAKPKYLGSTQQSVVVSDFSLIHCGMLFVENSLVIKGNSNASEITLEAGDEVYYKKITNSGDPLMLLGHTYNAGDKQLRTSYTQNNTIDT